MNRSIENSTCYVTRGALGIDDLAGVLRVPALHDHQVRAIRAVAGGRDTLVVAPTGSGKSEIFFGAGLLRGGVTVVASPLRSLIADQHRRLTELGLPVRIWNSDCRDSYKDETTALLRSGWQGFVVTTPESLKGRQLFSALANRIDLAVIDEAHCALRERGFRVSYAWLGKLIDRLHPSVRFACTATLPAADRSKLTKTLNLTDPLEIVLPIARSNLSIHICDRHPTTLTRILNEHTEGSGLIFCATVRAAQTIHTQLQAQRRSVVLYHGRLTAKTKKTAHEAFMSGDKRVAIATDAFILGIDKADIRFVVHFDPPKSIADWVQGFGRAGRDGLSAKVYGCFQGSTEGKRSRQFLINAAHPAVNDLREVWEYLIAAPFRDQTQSAIGEHVLGSRGRYCGGAIITTLERHGLCKADPHPTDHRRKTYRGTRSFDAVDWSAYVAEQRQTRRRFAELCELARLPEAEIAGAIDQHFEAPDQTEVIA